MPRYNNYDEHHYTNTDLLPAFWTDHVDDEHEHH